MNLYIQIKSDSEKVSRGDSFYVPPHNTYNLLNLSATQVQTLGTLGLAKIQGVFFNWSRPPKISLVSAGK